MGFRPRFSLKTLFLLLTVGCIVGSWAAYQLKWMRQRHSMLTEFQEAGTGQAIGSVSPPVSLRFFGEQGVDVIVTYAAQYDLAHELFPRFILLFMAELFIRQAPK